MGDGGVAEGVGGTGDGAFVGIEFLSRVLAKRASLVTLAAGTGVAMTVCGTNTFFTTCAGAVCVGGAAVAHAANMDISPSKTRIRILAPFRAKTTAVA